MEKSHLQINSKGPTPLIHRSEIQNAENDGRNPIFWNIHLCWVQFGPVNREPPVLMISAKLRLPYHAIVQSRMIQVKP